jgi:hypothetical protein
MSEGMQYPTPVPPRPSLKRSFTSILSNFTRKQSARAPVRASSWDRKWHPHPEHPRKVGFDSSDPYSTRSQVEVIESGGSALSEAQDAFTNSKRAVWTRILWTVPLEYDPTAQRVLSKITHKDAAEGLSLLAVSSPQPLPIAR